MFSAQELNIKKGNKQRQNLNIWPPLQPSTQRKIIEESDGLSEWEELNK